MALTARKDLAGICVITMLAGCGGGGSGSTSTQASTTTTPAPTPAPSPSPSPIAALSADQTAFQGFTLTPNVSESVYSTLPYTGAPTTAMSDYLAYTSGSLAASPASGTQRTVDAALVSISRTLPIPSSASNPTRYLVNGQIVIDPGPAAISNVSYQGTGVREDSFAADGATMIQSRLRSNFSVVSLTGTVASAPADLAHWLNFLYYNPSLLSSTATWGAGAAYEKYTETEIGDTYIVEDSATTTTGNMPDPTATNTTIAALIAAGGIHSSSDATTYTLSNGAVSVINGVTTYVSTAVRPNHTTAEYHTYYNLNGNVYTGNLIKDGTVIGGNPYAVASAGATNGYVLNYSGNYQIRMNPAMVSSLQAAVSF
jgi:hypothetical protein